MRRLILAVCIALAACVAPGAPQREEVGRIEVDGRNAYLNRILTSSGARVFLGDDVATGPDTSVKVLLRAGGYIQLDEKTDPKFFEEVGCLVIQIVSGRVFTEGSGLCIHTEDLAGRLGGSRVHIATGGGHTDIVVLEGSFTIQRPARLTLTQFDYYAVTRGKLDGPHKLSRERAESVAAWTRKWFKPATDPIGYCCDSGTVSETAKANCRGYFSFSKSLTDAECRRPRPEDPPTRVEIDETIADLNTLVNILNEVISYVNSVGQSLNQKNHQAAEKNLENARKAFSKSDVSFERLGKKKSRAAFQNAYRLAQGARELQIQILTLAPTMISLRRSGDIDGYNKSVAKNNQLIWSYNEKIRQLGIVTNELKK